MIADFTAEPFLHIDQRLAEMEGQLRTAYSALLTSPHYEPAASQNVIASLDRVLELRFRVRDLRGAA